MFGLLTCKGSGAALLFSCYAAAATAGSGQAAGSWKELAQELDRCYGIPKATDCRKDLQRRIDQALKSSRSELTSYKDSSRLISECQSKPNPEARPNAGTKCAQLLRAYVASLTKSDETKARESTPAPAPTALAVNKPDTPLNATEATRLEAAPGVGLDAHPLNPSTHDHSHLIERGTALFALIVALGAMLYARRAGRRTGAHRSSSKERPERSSLEILKRSDPPPDSRAPVGPYGVETRRAGPAGAKNLQGLPWQPQTDPAGDVKAALARLTELENDLKAIQNRLDQLDTRSSAVMKPQESSVDALPAALPVGTDSSDPFQASADSAASQEVRDTRDIANSIADGRALAESESDKSRQFTWETLSPVFGSALSSLYRSHASVDAGNASARILSAIGNPSLAEELRSREFAVQFYFASGEPATLGGELMYTYLGREASLNGWVFPVLNHIRTPHMLDWFTSVQSPYAVVPAKGALIDNDRLECTAKGQLGARLT